MELDPRAINEACRNVCRDVTSDLKSSGRACPKICDDCLREVTIAVETYLKLTSQ